MELRLRSMQLLFLTSLQITSTLDVGLFLQTMNASGGDGVQVGYILKLV